jgi:hypothetical protein
MQKLFIVTILLCLVIFAGCKKDEATSPNATAPSIPTVTFKGPSASESHAQTANAYAQSMTGLMSASAAFSFLPANQNGDVSTWTITTGPYSQTFTSTKQGDGSYTWAYVLNGTLGSTTYSNWTYWTGTTSADGKSGTWIFYEYGRTTKVEDLSYTTDANGVLTGTWQIYNTSGTLSSKFVITNNTDNSGEYNQYSDGTHLSLKVTWNTSGTGTWTTYNTSGGTTGSGTF